MKSLCSIFSLDVRAFICTVLVWTLIGVSPTLHAEQSQDKITFTPVGESVALDDRLITVHEILPHSEPAMQRFGHGSGFALRVTIENTGKREFRFSPLHFTARHEDGRRLRYLDSTPGGKSPRLRSQQVLPGEKISGYITYVGATPPVTVYYYANEKYARFCTDCSRLPETSPKASAAVAKDGGLPVVQIGETIRIDDREITIHEVVRYTEAGMSDYARRQGFSITMRITMQDEEPKSPSTTDVGIAIDVTLRNLGRAPFTLSPLNFVVSDQEGQQFIYFDVSSSGKMPKLREDVVIPGETVRAWITYIGKERPATIYYKGYKLGQNGQWKLKAE